MNFLGQQGKVDLVNLIGDVHNWYKSDNGVEFCYTGHLFQGLLLKCINYAQHSKVNQRISSLLNCTIILGYLLFSYDQSS